MTCRVGEHLASLHTAQTVRPSQFTPIHPTGPARKPTSKSKDRSRDLSRPVSRPVTRPVERSVTRPLRDASVDQDNSPAWNERCFIDLRSAETDELHQDRVGQALAGAGKCGSESEGIRREQALIELLIESNLADNSKVAAAKKIAKSSPGTRFTDLLIDQGVDELGLTQAVATVYRLPFQRIADDADPSGTSPRTSPTGSGSRSARALRPSLRAEGSRLVLATSAPMDSSRSTKSACLRARSISLVVVPARDIRLSLDRLDTGDAEGEEVEAILSDIDEDDVQVVRTLRKRSTSSCEAAESPVIRYVNYIIQQAVKGSASDIHYRTRRQVAESPLPHRRHPARVPCSRRPRWPPR